MKNPQTIRFAALGLGLLIPTTLAFMPTGTSIRFAPEEGLELTKTFVQKSTATLDSVELTMGDESQDVDEVPDITIDSTETIVFQDTYGGTEDGHSTKLTRTYEDLGRTREQSTPDEDTSTEESSDLADQTVIYNWDDDDETYSAAFDEDSDGDEDLLDPTWCEADMLGFLPDGEVDEGDTWDVDIDAWRHVLEPGGDLTFLDEDGESNTDEIDQEISDSLDGDIECEFKGFREDDDVRLAVIAVTIDVSGDGDLEEDLEVDDEHVSSATQTRTVSVETEIEGEILWDVSAGHMVSFNAVGESTVEMNEGLALELETGDTWNQSQLLTFSSELELDFTFE